ncbi:MAG: glycosyltransferase family 39 protein [Acidimicrobiales bacterium]
MDLISQGTDPDLPSARPSPLLESDPPIARAPISAGWRAAVVIALVIGVAARFATWSHLWFDEALTVNIARLPLGEIHEALRHDGAPPLYYVVLHAWMVVFGDSNLAVRMLPGLFGLAALPLTFLAARRIGGRRVAWAATLLMASGPFAIRYATESRMYSMVMVLVLLALLAVLALLEGGGRRHQVALALLTTAILLSHYWSLYLLAVSVAALAWLARSGRDPNAVAGLRDPNAVAGHAVAGARRSLVAIFAGCVLFLPWAPTFLYQLAHTGTPWGRPGNLRSMFDTVTHFAGGYWDPGIALGLMYFGLIGLALFGWAVEGRGRRVLLDFHPRSPGKWLTTVAFGTLAVAIVAGQVGRSAFAVRYAAVLYPLFVILVALGTNAIADQRVFHGVLAVAVVLGFWANIPNVVGDRTSAGRVASAINAGARAGDVIAYCPDQLGPSVSREIRTEGLIQLTFPSATGPELVDWVDYERFSRAGRTQPFAQMLSERAGPANDVWLVWAPGYRTFGTKCSNLVERLDDIRPDNTRVITVSTKYFERPGLVRFRPAAAS